VSFFYLYCITLLSPLKKGREKNSAAYSPASRGQGTGLLSIGPTRAFVI
jgi:hypothetical protein